jgi:hypothetical protein
MSTMPFELVVLGDYIVDYEDFATLCINKFYKVDKESEFIKVLKQGCDEQYMKLYLKPRPWTYCQIV